MFDEEDSDEFARAIQNAEPVKLLAVNLVKRLARVRRRFQSVTMVGDLLLIGRRCAPEPDSLVIDYADLLYDEDSQFRVLFQPEAAIVQGFMTEIPIPSKSFSFRVTRTQP